MRVRASIVVLATAACSGGGAQPSTNAFYIEQDTVEACNHSEAQSWSNVVFVSDKWRDLSVRADASEPQAWAEIADMMEAHQKENPTSPCTPQLIAEVREAAKRLAP